MFFPRLSPAQTSYILTCVNIEAEDCLIYSCKGYVILVTKIQDQNCDKTFAFTIIQIYNTIVKMQVHISHTMDYKLQFLSYWKFIIHFI